MPPFRPTVSSIGTYNYELAKYLCSLLQLYIPTNYCAQDSFTFVNEIQDIPLSGNFMVSFDVESLFTNIPLDECIAIFANLNRSSHPLLLDYKSPELQQTVFFQHLLLNSHFLNTVLSCSSKTSRV